MKSKDNCKTWGISLNSAGTMSFMNRLKFLARAMLFTARYLRGLTRDDLAVLNPPTRIEKASREAF